MLAPEAAAAGQQHRDIARLERRAWCRQLVRVCPVRGPPRPACASGGQLALLDGAAPSPRPPLRLPHPPAGLSPTGWRAPRPGWRSARPPSGNEAKSACRRGVRWRGGWSAPSAAAKSYDAICAVWLMGVVFYLYGQTTSQLSAFHSRLEVLQHYLLANSMCEGLSEDERDKARAALIGEISRAPRTETEYHRSPRLGVRRPQTERQRGLRPHQQPKPRRSARRCRRKIEMTPGAQSRNDTPPPADTPSATRHHCHTLGLGGGVKGQSRRLPVRAAQPLRPSPRPSTIEQPCEPAEPLRGVSRDRNRWAGRSQRACRGQDQRWLARRPRSSCPEACQAVLRARQHRRLATQATR